MEASLIDRAARLLAEMEAGAPVTEAVDWTVSPPEGGDDPGYALGVFLWELCLDEPRLAPLAEALTRPQPPARPAAAERAAFLSEARWENPFVIVCGRLLDRGPRPERSAAVIEALDRLGPRAASVAPVLRKLIGAVPSAAPAPRVLVFADELCADPQLFELYLTRFGADPDAALVIYAPGWTAEETATRLGPLLGEAAETAQLIALAVEASSENDRAAAESATALISAREPGEPFAALPRIAPAPKAQRVPAPAARDYLALCAIFKNEARYFQEWIEFHRLVGVEHFYLYENHSDDDYASVLEPYVREGIVTLHNWPADPGQNSAYTHCANTYADRAEWIGFVDADEFFFAPGGDLHAALRPFEQPAVGGVAVNYVNFGTSGHVETPAGLVLENYLRRAGHETALDLPAGLKAPGLDPTDLRNYYPLNARISSVVRPARTARFEIPHYPVYKPGFYAVTENQQRLDGAIAPQTSVHTLRMNHYWTKSEQECKAKFERGRSDQAKPRVWPDDFLQREQALNEVVDTEILAWLDDLRAVLGLDGPSVAELEAAANDWHGVRAGATV
ncbi:MAG TPA: glycosyltransferase family 92 protein [Gaiellaceae bacterium]|nr:glycosyltransferase family 92 protein [Gaiellaceae bacterium]